jgi:hypothetical protein
MFLYLCGRVIDQSADDIHEHEVGREVFGRPDDYDTAADNIVRVHASMLRKRIDQYFAAEGRSEPTIIEIPRGNYAPVFRARPAGAIVPQPIVAPVPAEPVATPAPVPLPADLAPVPPPRRNWHMLLPSALALIFACSTFFLLLRTRDVAHANISIPANQVNVRKFWSQIFYAERPTDIVLDDAAVGFYQELTSQQVSLSDYFDRSYLRSLTANTAKPERDFAEPFLLKRQSSFADLGICSRLMQTAAALQGSANIRFARDFSFREVKSGNVILLGNSRSNPWIQPFEARLALRWRFDAPRGIYYPTNTAAPTAEQDKFRATAEASAPHQGYATVSLLPNMNDTGKVLILTGTGGSALNAALDFLSDEHSVSEIRSGLPQSKSNDFPYFEALLKTESRTSLPRNTTIVLLRHTQP